MTDTKAMGVRLPTKLIKRIEKQMQLERRTSKSQMVQILIEDGLNQREKLRYPVGPH